MAGIESRFSRLRLYNAVMGTLHLAQAVIVLLLATDFSLPVTASFLQGQPGATPPELTTLFDVSLAWGVAAFLFLSAAAHWILVLPGVFPWYVRNLDRQRNYARWAEYSLSASLMIVLIALLTGISDAAALIALFGVNASMILFGRLQEKYEEPGAGGLDALRLRLPGRHRALARHRRVPVESYHSPPSRPPSSMPSSYRCSCSSTASPSTSSSSTSGWVPGAITCSENRRTCSSASSPSRLWPGRSSPARWPVERRRSRGYGRLSTRWPHSKAANGCRRPRARTRR